MGRQFKEQIIWLGHVWDNWTEAERVIATYSVLQKLSPASTRFILTLLEQNLLNEGPELASAELKANDAAWVSRIPEASDGGATELLQHLPLLRVSNTEAKNQYLSVIPKVLAETLSQPHVNEAALEKARHVLSYSLVHPAIALEEKRTFGPWIKSFEDKLAQTKQCDFESSCENADEEVIDEQQPNVELADKTKLDFKEAPLRTSSTSEDKSKNSWNGNRTDQFLKDYHRWSYLESSLSPNHSGNSSRSSGSESVTDDPHNTSYHSGRKDISVWLKSLRLHKYDPLLSSLTYEELLSLTEEDLETKGVTQGARNKILLSIAKLRTRDQQLMTIEEDLMASGNIQVALHQLKALIITPMLPHNDNTADIQPESQEQSEDQPLEDSSKLEDLPSRFTRVLGKVCTQLLVCARPDDDCVSSFLGLVEKCLHHDAFSVTLKKRLLSWKQQIRTIWHPMPSRTKDGRHLRRWSHQFSGEVSAGTRTRCQQRYSTPTSQMALLSGPGKAMGHPFVPSMGFFSLQPSVSIMAPRTSLHIPGNTSLLSPQHFFAKRPSLQETTSELKPHVTLQRTRSAPSRPNQVLSLSQSRSTGKGGDRVQSRNGPTSELQSLQEGSPHVLPDVIDPDITNRLESLCLSMTEHALG